MSDYMDLVKKEAEEFYDKASSEFAEDAENHGGKSDKPNLMKWVDETDKLSVRVEEVVSKWGHKEYLWVQSNTRNRNKHGGGDKRSNAFASFLQDVRHAVKKLSKS